MTKANFARWLAVSLVVSSVLWCPSFSTRGAATGASQNTSEPDPRMVSGVPSSPFASALISSGASPQMPKSAVSVYDLLIGDWEADVYDYEPDGSKRVNKGEWHFSWVLEGRGIQDVWIAPEQPERSVETPAKNNRYGTTAS